MSETFADLYDCVSKTVKSVYAHKIFLGLARERREMRREERREMRREERRR